MKRVSRQHEATYSEVKRLLMELPSYCLNSNLLYRGAYSGQIFIQAHGYNNAIIGRDELGINNNNYIIYANVHQRYFESASTANINIEIGYVISEDNRINLSFYNNTTSDRLFAYQVEVLFRENKP